MQLQDATSRYYPKCLPWMLFLYYSHFQYSWDISQGQITGCNTSDSIKCLFISFFRTFPELFLGISFIILRCMRQKYFYWIFVWTLFVYMCVCNFWLCNYKSKVDSQTTVAETAGFLFLLLYGDHIMNGCGL